MAKYSKELAANKAQSKMTINGKKIFTPVIFKLPDL
jgi:hypothetical protein